MDMHQKQRCIIEFLHAEKIEPINIHQRLVYVYKADAVDISTVRRWVRWFLSGDRDVSDKVRSVFWDRKDAILLDFLEPGVTVIFDRYVETLIKLKARDARVRPEKRETFRLQHNNAKPYTRLKTMECVTKFGWTVLSHPVYNPDLAPSDFYLFGFPKNELQRSSLNAQERDQENVRKYRKRIIQAIEPYVISEIGTGSHQDWPQDPSITDPKLTILEA